MINQAELTLFSKDAHTAGFRLERFEVFNWGAFHQKVYAMPLQGENALLTGANGAGKTTLVDALITLLNPTPERYYNQSAGFEDRKRTRKLEEYVHGVFGHSENGREQLRNKPGQQASYTVLLGVFTNKDTAQTITLAHLYWFKPGELQKKYFVSTSDLSITEHFRFQGDIRKFSNELSKRVRVESFDTFTEYAGYMQPKLGMRFNERGKTTASRTKPLQLLAKTAGIKVLGNLDQFIRENMLDEAPLETHFDQLKKEYADIAETQNTLDKVSKQEEMLIPLLTKNTERIQNEDELNRKLRIIGAIGPYFARYHAKLLEQELESLGLKLKQNADRIARIREQLESQRNEEYDLRSQIDSHDAGKRLQELKRLSVEYEKELRLRRSEAEKYARLADSVGLSPEVDAAFFYVQRNQIVEKSKEFQHRMDLLTTKRDRLVNDRFGIASERDQIMQELESLRNRKNSLPIEFIRLRARMIADLGLDEKEIPFVAELVQLKAKEKAQWQHAIEKLLSPFSLHLLVPRQHLKRVVEWVRGNNTGILLRFLEAEQNAAEFIINDQSAHIASGKLEIKEDSDYAHWLKAELYKRFPHYCTTDTLEYERKKQALTPEGLVKNEKHHQKDDRKHRSNSYVLGWDNSDTIHRLELEMQVLQRQIVEINERMLPIEEENNLVLNKLTDLQRLFDFEQFNRIDIHSVQTALTETLSQIEELTKTSDAYRVLNERLETVRRAIYKSESQSQAETQLKGNLEAQIQQRKTELTMHQNDAGQGKELDIHRIAVEQFVGDLPDLSLETIERKRKEIESRLYKETDSHKTIKTQLEKDIERLMVQFKNPKKEILETYPSWPNDTDRLGSPTIEHISAYTDLLEVIQNDALPKLKERFEARTRQDMSKSFLLFERSLKEQLGDHEDHIKNMNQALRELPYTHDTYLQIVVEPNYRRGRIGEFYAMLDLCRLDQTALKFANTHDQQDMLRNHIGQIGALIQKLDSQPDWRREVTDVRNWLSFKTQQVYQQTDTVMVGTLQDSTSGKSGGEQAKLTYTVLAAALTYQFNITNQRNANSFRFIVVDEAFSKLDPENSTYLLRLLSSLKFQMLIITPNNFSKTNEDLMSHLIYIQKISETPPQSAAHHFTKLAWKQRNLS